MRPDYQEVQVGDEYIITAPPNAHLHNFLDEDNQNEQEGKADLFLNDNEKSSEKEDEPDTYELDAEGNPIYPIHDLREVSFEATEDE